MVSCRSRSSCLIEQLVTLVAQHDEVVCEREVRLRLGPTVLHRKPVWAQVEEGVHLVDGQGCLGGSEHLEQPDKALVLRRVAVDDPAALGVDGGQLDGSAVKLGSGCAVDIIAPAHATAAGTKYSGHEHAHGLARTDPDRSRGRQSPR